MILFKLQKARAQGLFQMKAPWQKRLTFPNERFVVFLGASDRKHQTVLSKEVDSASEGSTSGG